MSIFKKEAPKACPKCGDSAGWHFVPAEEPRYEASAVNPFSAAPIRGSFGQNMTRAPGKNAKRRWRCEACGFEKTY